MTSSTTTMTLRYPSPPPTSNNLDSTQRARLMRSTRKLGDVLGATPHLIEALLPELPIALLPIGSRSQSPAPSTRSTASSASNKSIKSSRRHGSIFTHSQVSSISAAASPALPQSFSSSSINLPSTKKPSVSYRSADAHRPRPLVLHLNPVPLSPSDPRVTTFPQTPTPTSALFSLLTPTLNLSLAEQQNAEARRRKMSKVTRTLGENISPELVFPAPKTPCRPRVPSNSRQQTRSRNRRSMSVGAVAQPQVWSTGAVCSHGRQPGWVGEWNRRDIRDVQKQLRGLKAR